MCILERQLVSIAHCTNCLKLNFGGKRLPQGLKPFVLKALIGTTEVVLFQNIDKFSVFSVHPRRQRRMLSGFLEQPGRRRANKRQHRRPAEDIHISQQRRLLLHQPVDQTK